MKDQTKAKIIDMDERTHKIHVNLYALEKDADVPTIKDLVVQELRAKGVAYIEEGVDDLSETIYELLVEKNDRDNKKANVSRETQKQNDKLEPGMAVILDDKNRIRSCQTDLTKDIDGIIVGCSSHPSCWTLKDDGVVWLEADGFDIDHIYSDQKVYVDQTDGTYHLEDQDAWFRSYIGIIYMEDAKDLKDSKLAPVTLRLRAVKKMKEHARKANRKEDR